MADKKDRTPENQLDPVRKLILDTIRSKPGVSFAGVSLAVSPSGRGQSYLSDFIWYGHGVLPEGVRYKLAKHLDLPETDLRPSGFLGEPGAGYDQPPAVAPKEAPIAPYEARDLMADLTEGLDRLHREERLALSLQELGLAAWEMHGEIMAMGGDLKAGLERAPRARRRHLRAERAKSLTTLSRTAATG